MPCAVLNIQCHVPFSLFVNIEITNVKFGRRLPINYD